MNPFEVLNVPYDATSEEIKRAYRKLAKVYHPDMGGRFASADMMQQLAQAYEILCDDEQREWYRAFYTQPRVEAVPDDPQPADNRGLVAEVLIGVAVVAVGAMLVGVVGPGVVIFVGFLIGVIAACNYALA